MYPSFQQILIILVILLLLFGHKKIREFGKSLGEALRDFKKGLDGKTSDPPESPAASPETPAASPETPPTSAETSAKSEESNKTEKAQTPAGD